jgi:hypothetical protein
MTTIGQPEQTNGYYEFCSYDKTLTVLAAARGETLASVSLGPGEFGGEGQRLVFRFVSGGGFYLYDDSYPTRYMTTDDDLAAFVGATFTGAEVRPAPDSYEPEYDQGEWHDIAFLVVFTSLGEFTCETHNWHNGYYGGFSIRACALNEPVVAA